MSGYGLFQPATLGMQSQSHKLNTIGYNIANVNSGGFKRTDTMFQTVLSDTIDTQSDYGGVKPFSRATNDVQGLVQSTGRKLDLAISGDGFFGLQSGLTSSDSLFYTRDGSFQINTVEGQTSSVTADDGSTITVSNGYLVDKNGYFLLGVPVSADGTFSTSGAAPMRVDQYAFTEEGQPTTAAELEFNLPSNHEFGDDAFTYALRTYDSNATERNVTFDFARRTENNQWRLDTRADNLTSATLTPSSVRTVTAGATPGTFMSFSSADKTIRVRDLTTGAPVADSFNAFAEGDSITITGSGSNNGTYTVSSVSETGGTITVTEALMDETGATVVTNGALTNETLAVSATTETPVGSVGFQIPADPVGVPSINSAGGDVTFDNATGTITSTTVGLFATLNPGDFFTVSGSGSNNVTFQVGARDATNSIITLATAPTTVTLAAGTTLTNAATGRLTFSNAGETVTAATNGAFSGVTAGETIQFTGTDNNNATYVVSSVSADGTTLTLANGATGYSSPASSSLASTNPLTDPLIFSANGTLQSPTEVTYSATWDDGATSSFTIDFSGMTQYNGDFTVYRKEQDGLGLSDITDVSFDGVGHVVGNFADGTTRTLYKIPLYDFTNPNALNTQNGMLFTETEGSGAASSFFADESSKGGLSPGAVEVSNVDIAQEFSQMIQAQNAYNMSATTFKTIDEMTTVARDLKA
tara:strand:+ start:233 stop:2335 length:2103 start_codon:yes stop_codon:yes gene_type:complete